MGPRRRLSRSVVFALVLLASARELGSPFGIGSHWGDQVLVAAGLAVPATCLLAILAPSSLGAVFVYRVVGAVAALLVLAVLLSTRDRADGRALYVAAIVAGLAAEILPARAARKPDVTDVFR